MSRGVQRRVGRQLREAALAATPDERVELDRLSVLLSTGQVTILEASALLRVLLRTQNDRKAA